MSTNCCPKSADSESSVRGRVNQYMQEKIPGELIFARIHAGPVFALARIQENIFEEVFPEYFAKLLGEFTRCEYMPRLYSGCEYRKYSWRIIYVLVSCQGVVFEGA